MNNAIVSEGLGEAILLSQDNLQEILLNMVLLGEPSEEYERLMVLLSYLMNFSEELEKKAVKFKEGTPTNVVFTEF